MAMRSESDVDTAKANEGPWPKPASIIAEAEIMQAKAAVEMAQLNLEYTKIISPVDGVVIDRRVNVGQIVVAGLNAPSLFLIARDLKKLEIWASVNEADIAQVQVGQNAQFTVAALPERTFQAKVSQVRLNAQMTQNVVTYTVVVSVDNPDGKLLPYMTADVQFETARHVGALMVPNAALRWRPQSEWIAPDARDKAADVAKPAGSERSDAKVASRRVWVRDGKFVRPIDVKLGPTDGATTEIRAGDLNEGDEVVVNAIIADTSGESPRTGNGASLDAQAMQRTIDSMGRNLLLVMPGAAVNGISFGSQSTLTLTAEDAEDIAINCPAVSQAAPLCARSGPDHLRWQQLGADDDLWNDARVLERAGLG